MSGIEQAIEILIESNKEIKTVQTETNKTLNELLKFQVRTEERNNQRHEFEKRIATRTDKLEDKVSTLWDMVHKNSIVVNGAIGFGCLVAGSVATWLLGVWSG